MFVYSVFVEWVIALAVRCVADHIGIPRGEVVDPLSSKACLSPTLHFWHSRHVAPYIISSYIQYTHIRTTVYVCTVCGCRSVAVK